MVKAATEQAASVYKGKALQHDQVIIEQLYPLYSLTHHSGGGGKQSRGTD